MEVGVQDETRDATADPILALLKLRGVMRARDFREAGFSASSLSELVAEGEIVRESRGVYALPDADITENHSLVEVAVKVPLGVVCLLSALRFHEIGTQNPPEVWLAIHPKARRPTIERPRLHIVRFSGPFLTLGVDEHVIEGVTVKVTSAAKTVVDCFRYRNKLGVDTAIEALKDYLWRGESPDELWHLAQACRMARVMQPYIEAIQ